MATNSPQYITDSPEWKAKEKARQARNAAYDAAVKPYNAALAQVGQVRAPRYAAEPSDKILTRLVGGLSNYLNTRIENKALAPYARAAADQVRASTLLSPRKERTLSGSSADELDPVKVAAESKIADQKLAAARAAAATYQRPKTSSAFTHLDPPVQPLDPEAYRKSIREALVSGDYQKGIKATEPARGTPERLTQEAEARSKWAFRPPGFSSEVLTKIAEAAREAGPAMREAVSTPAPATPATPTAPAPTATPAMPRDLLDRRVAFAKELKDSARVGGYNPAEAVEQARSLNISPEDFARFAKRESLGELQAQQERQMIQPVGSDSALNLRRGLQTEAGRAYREADRLQKKGFGGAANAMAAQAAQLKMDTPGIRTQDQRIAEQQGQEKAAAAFQANEDQYAGLMKQMAGDPKGRKMLDKWMKKNQAKAS